MEKQRRQRIKGLVRSLNTQRRQQNRKMDILCNDIIASQKNFVEKLTHYNFVLDFYENIIGQTNLRKLISSAGQKIKDIAYQHSLGLYILETGRFEFLSDSANTKIDTIFSQKISETIARSNTILSANELCSIGLDSDLPMLKKIDICTIPISGFGSAVGFLALWSVSPNCLKQSDIVRIQSVCPCLAKAVRCCQQKHHSLKKVSV